MTPRQRRAAEVLLRLLAAVFGGYALASLAATAIAFGMPWCCGWSRAEGVLAGSLLSFAWYAGAAVWAFNVRVSGVLAMLAVAMVLSILLPW